MIIRVLKSWVFWLCLTLTYLTWPEPDYQLDLQDLYIVTGVDFKVFGQDYSITAYPFIFISKTEKDNLERVLRHEFCHVIQQKREGFFFPIKYYYYFSVNYLYYSIHYPEMKRRTKILYAYRNNPYEKEAYDSEE